MPEGINKTSFGFYEQHSLKAEKFATINSWIFLGFTEVIVTYFNYKKYPEIYLLSVTKKESTKYWFITVESTISLSFLRLKSQKLRLTAMLFTLVR